MKLINQAINKWQNAIHDVKQGNRDSFVALVKEGGGDHYYAKDCEDKEAIIQIKMALEILEAIKAGEIVA